MDVLPRRPGTAGRGSSREVVSPNRPSLWHPDPEKRRVGVAERSGRVVDELVELAPQERVSRSSSGVVTRLTGRSVSAGSGRRASPSGRGAPWWTPSCLGLSWSRITPPVRDEYTSCFPVTLCGSVNSIGHLVVEVPPVVAVRDDDEVNHGEHDVREPDPFPGQRPVPR